MWGKEDASSTEAEGGGDRQDGVEAAADSGEQQHLPDSRVDWQRAHMPAERCELIRGCIRIADAPDNQTAQAAPGTASGTGTSAGNTQFDGLQLNEVLGGGAHGRWRRWSGRLCEERGR